MTRKRMDNRSDFEKTLAEKDAFKSQNTQLRKELTKMRVELTEVQQLLNVKDLGVQSCNCMCLPVPVPVDPEQKLDINCAVCGIPISFLMRQVYISGPSYVCRKHAGADMGGLDAGKELYTYRWICSYKCQTGRSY